MGTENLTKKRGRKPRVRPTGDGPETVVILASGVDTMHLFSRAPVQPAQVGHLERAQERAKAQDKRRPGPVVEVAGHFLRIARHGARTAPFLLESEHMAVLVSPHAARTFPTCTIELRAKYLWAVGAAAALHEAERVADALLMRDGAEKQLHVGRCDLAVDFQGWEPGAELVAASVADESALHFTAKSRDVGAYFAGRRFTGLMFGRGNVAARLYDKTAEIKAKGNEKAWFADDVWSKCQRFDPARPVWRLEYQLRREAFTGDRPIRLKGGPARLDYAADVLAHARALWRYLAGPWLSLREPRREDDRQERQAAWEALEAGGFADGVWSGTDGEVYRKERESKADAAVAQLAGYLANVHAYGLFKRSRDGRDTRTLDEALPEILQAARDYAAERGQTIEQRAEETAAKWLAVEESMLMSDDLRGPEPREPGSDDGDDDQAEPDDLPTAQPAREPRFKVTVSRPETHRWVLAVIDETLPRWDQVLHMEEYNHTPTASERADALALVARFGRYTAPPPGTPGEFSPSAAERLVRAIESIRGGR